MSLYSISLFVHVLGSLVLASVLALEGAALSRLRRATTTAAARECLALLVAAPRRIAGPAALAVVLSGVHMTATVWGRQPWISVGLVALVAIAALGAALGARRAGTLERRLPSADAPLPPALRVELGDPWLALSFRLRTSLLLGVVALMTAKPGLAGSLATMAVAAALGVVASLAARQGAIRPSQNPA